MKSKIIALAMLFVSVATWAGMVTVSDPGQAQGKLITTMDIVPFVNVALTASNVSDQTVYLTIKQSGAGSDIDLFTGSGCSNKLTGMQTVLGPFVVKSGQTNNIVVSARINSVKATNSSPTVSLNLTAVSNSTPILVQGTLPIVGTSYIVDTNSIEVIKGKLTFVSLTYHDDEYGMYYVMELTGVADHLRTYSLEHSLDMISWENWLDWIQPGYSDTFGLTGHLNATNFPSQGFFRLESGTSVNSSIAVKYTINETNGIKTFHFSR